MTYFLNLRSHAVGGWVDTSDVKIQLDPPATAGGFTQNRVDLSKLRADLRGQHVLIGVHGFNVDFASGVEHLSYWGSLLQPPTQPVFVGLLWPGDSVWAHGLDYPEEPRIADESGARVAAFVEGALADVASISFVSHSLGARVALQTVNRMTDRVRRLTLMAGAIDDNCLNTEFQKAAQKVDEISVLASKADEVLELAFPLGNLLAGIIDQGHPWWHGALGRFGPKKPQPLNFKAPFQIPDEWMYGHGDYLRDAPPAGGTIPLSDVEPFTVNPLPLNGAGGWQEAFSSAFVSLRSRL